MNTGRSFVILAVSRITLNLANKHTTHTQTHRHTDTHTHTQTHTHTHTHTLPLPLTVITVTQSLHRSFLKIETSLPSPCGELLERSSVA